MTTAEQTTTLDATDQKQAAFIDGRDAAETEEETKKRSEIIAKLNDEARALMGLKCRLVSTQGIAALPDSDRLQLLPLVEKYDNWEPGNNPYGERDFGVLYGKSNGDGSHQWGQEKPEGEHETIFWKIDYYALDMCHGSEDATDPTKTTRVLTIYLAREH